MVAHRLLGSLAVVLLVCMTVYLHFLNQLSRPKYDFNYDIRTVKTNISGRYLEVAQDSRDDLLLDTQACQIPNYIKTIKYPKPSGRKPFCGKRAIDIRKISDKEIQFIIDSKIMESYTKLPLKCYYQYVMRSTVPGNEDSQIKYSLTKPFKNGTKIIFDYEVITVSCSISKNKKYTTVYEDAYMITKKIKLKKDNSTKPKWNVLIIGLDTISRGRVLKVMPKTAEYLKQNGWLDYRGYQKLGYNTYPNLMAFLTGSQMSTVYNFCNRGMAKCRDNFIWSKFREAGYATAYGEDYVGLPDTFAHYGFETPPTDHYMRPLFLTKEVMTNNIVCNKKKASALQILDYAIDFTNTYENDNFFGMFWINSVGHSENQDPSVFDAHIAQFLDNLKKNNILDNTFVFFMSDHGIRFGKTRFQMEAHYEERLPMLYLSVPKHFRDSNSEEYKNLEINQYRLVTPYDIYTTFRDICLRANNSIAIKQAEGCPACEGILKEISDNRTCADAFVDEKWCSCHTMRSVSKSDTAAKASLDLAISSVNKMSKTVKTKECTVCQNMTLQNVIRIHTYHKNNKDYHVLAFEMTGGVVYEVITYKEGDAYETLPSYDTLTGYNSKGYCVKQSSVRGFCICKKDPSCKKV